MEFQTVSSAFASQELFRDKTWRLSPEPFPLDARQVEEIEAIGAACLSLILATERLYRRLVEGRRLLRNGDLEAPWVLDYLDAGKPDALIEHQRADFQKGRIPRVIRPDLLVTEEGFCLSELDSVPGGIGLTAFLNRLYAGEFPVIGAASGMIRAFDAAVSAEVPSHHNPFVAIVVSEEAETYRPEMEWLAAELQREGRRVFVYRPEDLMPLGESVCVDIDGSPHRVDVIYRFFELFDLPDLPLDFLLESVEKGHVALTPPLRPMLEEKLTLALFHHPVLEPFWKEQLGKRDWKLLHRIIPRSWVIDPTPVGPNAFLHSPHVGGRPPSHWSELANGTQRERNLILKLSGYHERAWGARSVTLGSDVSREEWGRALQEASCSWPENPYILQDFHKPVRVRHPLFREDGSIESGFEGRVRLCPYYFVGNGSAYGENVPEARLAGCLATVCPADKKIIHGMKDAALLPARPLPPFAG